MRNAFTRRRLLAALWAAGALLPALRRAHGLVAAPDPATRLVGLLRHRDSARIIGAAYLSTRPEEADARKLVEYILGADRAPPVMDRMSDTELRAWLRQRLGRDFATDRIVSLDGWLLSATEVRLCALAAVT
jgi:hypothetical protein